MTQKDGHWQLLGLLVCTTAILVGCQKADRPRTPADVKLEIYKHLAKQTGQKKFAPGIDVNLPAQVATLRSNATVLEQRTAALQAAIRALDEQPSSSQSEKRAALEQDLKETERAWEVARAEASRKDSELSNQEDNYIRSVRQQMSGVRGYDALYRLVGQQLATADRLLGETNLSRRRMGLKMAREACSHVNSDSVDIWLAARICEAYFWPNLDIVDTQPDSRERKLDLLETCRRVFFDTHETNNVLKNYDLLMANAPDARAADFFRVQLADWLEEKGDLRHAHVILSEIRDTQVLSSAEERITRVRERVAGLP